MGKAATASPGQAATAHQADSHSHEAALSSSSWAPGLTSAPAGFAAAGATPDFTMAGAARSKELETLLLEDLTSQYALQIGKKI